MKNKSKKKDMLNHNLISFNDNKSFIVERIMCALLLQLLSKKKEKLRMAVRNSFLYEAEGIYF